jgi:hypothetical protein
LPAALLVLGRWEKALAPGAGGMSQRKDNGRNAGRVRKDKVRVHGNGQGDGGQLLPDLEQVE